jgi:hypothetical protein
MHAATEQPPGLSGFSLMPQTGQDGVEVWFRAPPAARMVIVVIYLPER